MRALVTGGGGFLGKALIQRLVARGDAVRSLSRGSYPELDALGVEHVSTALTDAAAVANAAAGCDVVYHLAAKAGIWGPYPEYHEANVTGTENVIAACRKQGVGRLVFTGSPSSIFTGANQEGIDESTPYPRRFSSHYAKTKALSETAVLAANGLELATVSLRPRLIWGKGDPHVIPRIVKLAETGRLFVVGDGSHRVDVTYIDNAATAHVLACDALSPGAAVAGKAYFISNGEPIPMRALLDKILAAHGLPPVKKTMPLPLLYTLGAALEAAYTLLGKKDEPPMTRVGAQILGSASWFNIDAAKRDLGYVPAVSIDEGMRRLRD
ncbi:MAG: NAD-dependent epimerase/dehydratase family protein [Candidatus Hydrogenedentes bacterium]|nr:NAD-dependent epimerase/dehydratase family protein [Candidatus Hydrogenedentota bacterium]